MTRQLYEQEVRRHVLALRECLVRHDENEKAYKLLTGCVPYFLHNDPWIEKARNDQDEMTAHLRDPTAYADYYGNNPHELPFETMFGGTVEELVKKGTLARVEWVIGKLRDLNAKNVLDVACNDGAIAKYIAQEADCVVFGRDLNPKCIDGALARGVNAHLGTIEDESAPYDAIYAMEVIEHVPDPVHFLTQLAAHAPDVLISTPHGATEQGNVPTWDVVEYKGHVRAVLPEDVKYWGDEAGLETEFIGLTQNNIIVAHYSHSA